MQREIKGGFKTINPFTEKEIKSYIYFTDEEVTQAIDDCQKAFEKWRNVSLEDRAEVILNIGKELKNHKPELVQLMTDEMGKVKGQGEREKEFVNVKSVMIVE